MCGCRRGGWPNTERIHEPDTPHPTSRIALGNPAQAGTQCVATFDDEKFETIKREMSDLVDLRNNLVHHFLERFDLGSEEGCRQADAYLDECYAEIEKQFQTLRNWSKSGDTARKLMASFLSSPAGENILVHGILPDGQVLWSTSTIVELLREAEQACGQGEKTLLTDAIHYLARKHPEHTPKRYHCNSWRQVLHESRLFEFWKEADEGGNARTWYRSKQPRLA